jgi:cyclopropane-fatty-acyl-phospholipid synthase
MSVGTATRRLLPQPSRGFWPGLHAAPHARIHAAVARAITRRAVDKLLVTLRFPDGTAWGAGGPVLAIVRPENFFARLGRDGLIGLGEAWMTGELTAGRWRPGSPANPHGPGELDADVLDESTDALAGALTVLAGRLTELVPRPLQALRRWWQRRQPEAERNTVTGARDNIHRHYDLSNDMFATFLDGSMTYSSAWFDPAPNLVRPARFEELEPAQLRKIDGILDLARVRAGSRLVEIGSGWGALAIRAAGQRGATVTTLTLSQEQADLARRRITEAGRGGRVEVRLEDYRVHAAAHRGSYDAAASVEMIEAVGRQYWPDYFSSVQTMLRPGARFGLQAITVDHAQLLATSGSYTWIHKYVFPGGQLTSLPGIEAALAAHTGMRVQESRRLGESYATTLRLWRHRFNANATRVAELGFDETFRRMWTFYLAYSEAGFASGYLDDYQLGIG